MSPQTCSFVSLTGTTAATGADVEFNALGWQTRPSSSTRRRRPSSRRRPSWARISAASDSNCAASSCGADNGGDGASSVKEGGGQGVSEEAAKAAAAATVADLFLQLDASLDEDQLMVVGATSAPGATDDRENIRGTTTTTAQRGISVGNDGRRTNRGDNNTQHRKREEGRDARRSGGRGRAGREGGGGRGQKMVSLAEEVKAAAAKGSWEEACAVVARAKSSGLRLDGRVHTAVLHAALGGGGAQAALGAIADMRADKFVPNISLYNKAISLCGRKGLWKEAVCLLRDAQAAPPARRGVDVVTYSAAIAACRNAGEWKQALSLMEEMQATGMKPDQIAFGTAVSACAMGGQWERARSLLVEMRRSNLRPDVIAYSSAVKACGMDGRWEEALELLAEMQENGVTPNLITYTGAMEACGRAGKWKKALSLLSQVRDRGIQPDAFALNAVMDALARAGETTMALALLDTMRPTRRQASSSSSTRISRPDSAAHSPLGSPAVGVSSAVKDVNDADASAGFGRGRVGGGRGGGSGTGRPLPGRSGPRADVFTWSGAMTACIEGGCWERVVGMLEEMRGDGVPPNLINYNLAVKALGRGGDWERATSILGEMKSAGVAPDERTFSAAIEACGRGGCWERAVSLMDDMRREGLVPDQLTYSTVIAACDRARAWDVALIMLDEAREQKGQGANVFAYTSAISACGKAGQWEKAVSLLDVMRKERVLPNAITLRSVLLALENAPPLSLETQGHAASISWSNKAASDEEKLVPPRASDQVDSGSRLVGERAGTKKKRSRGGIRWYPPPPWEVAFSLLKGMASGALEEKVFPGPRDFSAGLTAACFGGAEWSSIEQMLDVMHACAATSASSCDEATAGDTGDSVTRWGVPVAAGSERIGNDEWGPGRGEQGIVQAYNYVIRTCGKAGGSEMALDLIQQMHKRGVTPDAASYSGAIIACDLAGMWDQAIALLDDMREKAGIEPDLVCYNCAVKACGSSGEWEEALSIVETMRARGVAPDEITYSSAITACGNSGEAGEALALLKKMKEAGIPAGLIAHNAAIGACDKGGEWAWTLQVLAEMRAAGIRPDVISYAGAISSVDRSGDWRLTLELYDQLREDMAEDAAVLTTEDGGGSADTRGGGEDAGGGSLDTTRPDTPLGTGQEIPLPRVTVAALTACARGAQWKKAVEIMREVSKTTGNDGGDGIWYHLGQASSLAFNAALVACAKGAEAEADEGRDGGWREALEILDMMGPTPDLTSYSCVITACGFGGNVEACVGLLGEMIRRNMTPTLADYHSSLRACATRRSADAAREILDSMASECVEPDARCYRFAAEACFGTGDDGKPSPEAERFLEMARTLEVSKEGVVLGGQDDQNSFLSTLDLSNDTTLRALLEPVVDEDFSGVG